jgi:hypothetical protein
LQMLSQLPMGIVVIAINRSFFDCFVHAFYLSLVHGCAGIVNLWSILCSLQILPKIWGNAYFWCLRLVNCCPLSVRIVWIL